MLDECWAGPPTKGIVPIEPFVAAKIKFFGRYKGGAIRDGVLLAIDRESATPFSAALGGAWSCDSDAVVDPPAARAGRQD